MNNFKSDVNIFGLKKIYDALVDEPSRFIFEQRLLYSLDGCKSHLRDMVKHEIERFSLEDVFYCLLKWLEGHDEEIVVFGAGFAGGQIVDTLRSFGREVQYIADNNVMLHGKERYGIKVISPMEIIRMSSVLVIIGVNSECGRESVYNQLIEMGISNDNIYNAKKDWWLGKYDQYFDEEILIHQEDEVFIDGGALDGCDSIRFVNWCNDKYARIYVLEPDHYNCELARKQLSDLRDTVVLEKGLWDQETILQFNSGSQENSAISEDGNVEIETIAIDDMKCDLPITFIKMDIEGSEGKALEGAERVIKEFRPKLAICIYHKPEDIIELPLKILELVPDYKFYFRHYSYTDTETVLYAI